MSQPPSVAPSADPAPTSVPVKKHPGRRLGSLVLWLAGAAAIFYAGQAWHEMRLGQQLAALAKPGDVRLLSSENCPYCTKARHWLQANRVPFSECLIERDAACAAEYQALQSPGTPVTLVRGKALLGFDPQGVINALGAAL